MRALEEPPDCTWNTNSALILGNRNSIADSINRSDPVSRTTLETIGARIIKSYETLIIKRAFAAVIKTFPLEENDPRPGNLKELVEHLIEFANPNTYPPYPSNMHKTAQWLLLKQQQTDPSIVPTSDKSIFRYSRHILSYSAGSERNRTITKGKLPAFFQFWNFGSKALEALGRLAIRSYQQAVVNVAFHAIEVYLPICNAADLNPITLRDLRDNMLEFARFDVFPPYPNHIQSVSRTLLMRQIISYGRMFNEYQENSTEADTVKRCFEEMQTFFEVYEFALSGLPPYEELPIIARQPIVDTLCRAILEDEESSCRTYFNVGWATKVLQSLFSRGPGFFKMYRHYINWFIREPYCTWDTASTSQITAFFDICLTIIDRALAQWPNLDGADFVPLPVLVKVVKRMRAEAIPEWHDVMCYLPLDMIVLMTAIRKRMNAPRKEDMVKLDKRWRHLLKSSDSFYRDISYLSVARKRLDEDIEKRASLLLSEPDTEIPIDEGDEEDTIYEKQSDKWKSMSSTDLDAWKNLVKTS